MQRKKYVSIICAGLALVIAGCGGSSSSNQTPVSGVKKRVLVSNQQGSAVTLINGQNDTRVTAILVTSPNKMVTAGGITTVLNTAGSQVNFIDNTKEATTTPGSLQGQPVDIAISPDGKTSYAAVLSVGVVEAVTSSSGNIVTSMPVPSASRLVEGPNGHKLLAFADDPKGLGGSLSNAFFVIDTATNTATAISPTSAPGITLDQPYTAVFDPSDSNDTTAFILNCGPECGGTAASVVKVSFSNPAAPVFSAPIPVGGATVGLLSNSNLFVAGTPQTSPAGCALSVCGSLQVINTGNLTAGPQIPITDGLHRNMALTTNNHLYVGAQNCTPGTVVANQVRGCLSIFNTGSAVSTSNPTFPSESSFRTNLNVTGMKPITGRNVIYVCQGGELDIYDFTTDTLTPTQIDIVGSAIDVVQIDP
jgi:hypothetical protein